MQLLSTRRARRRAAALTGGVVALSLSACGSFGGDEQASSSSSYEPVQMTSTTEPPTSTSTSTTDGEPRPEPPDAADLLGRAKDHMSVMSTVTIDGTGHLREDGTKAVPVTLHSEGSTGGSTSQGKDAGASKTTLTLQNGGTLEVQAQGWYHYLRADESWFEGLGTDGTRLARYADQWLKIPREDSPVERFSPNRLLNGTFFGEALTSVDAAKASGSTDRLDGEWVGRLRLDPGKEQKLPRFMWVSLDPAAPEMLKLTQGRDPMRTTYVFSKWDTTNDRFTPPRGAKAINDDFTKSILGS